LSRSVTRIVMIVGAPLLALTTITILGSHPTRPVAIRPATVDRVASLHALQAGVTGLGQADRRLRRQVRWTRGPLEGRWVALRARAPERCMRRSAGVGGAAGIEFSLVNQDRAANGVAPLAYSGALARVAQYRAQDMLNRNYFSHYDPATGQLAFVQLLHLWGIPYSTAGENIAWSTNPSMAGINTMFMNSPDHRANILKAAYHRVGLGVASNGAKVMVVEVFSN